MSQNIIEIKNLKKSFKKQTVLKNISLSIPENCVYGLLGPNGAGKSTLLKMMAGLLRPDSGEIIFRGHPWSRADLYDIGGLIETPPIYENLSAWENLKVRALILDETEERMKEVLKIADLTDTGKKPAGKFSLGMKQRLGIAIALLGRPKFLILDEPVNGLDPLGIQELRKLIRSFPKQGITVLVSSHILSEIQLTADYIGIMANGKLRYEGIVDESLDLEKLFMDIAAAERGVNWMKLYQKTESLTLYLKAEKMKYRRTFLWALMILMPAACSLLSAKLTYNYFAMDGYNWWYMMLLPGFLSIACGQIGGKDLKKKNRTIWALPADMGKIWDAKILLSAMATGIATLALMVFVLLGSLAMEKGLHITFINMPSVGSQVLAAFLIWITSLWQIPFCIFLVQKTGTLVMLVISLAFSQISGALLSLKDWFFLIPYGITPRVMCPVLKTLPNGLLAETGQMTYTPELMSVPSAAIGTAVSLLWFAVFWYFSRKWFKRQVERG